LFRQPLPQPPSASPSSSAVASWYCWYSDTRSFMLDSASVNSISSIPSPVYQWRKALRRNMAVNCSDTRLNSSWMDVLLPMKVADIFRPRGGMSQTAVLTLLGSTQRSSCCSCSAHSASARQPPSCSCDHGRWQPRSGSGRGAGHRQPSCSSSQTSAEPARTRSERGTAGCCVMSVARNQA
jgi:hypothetical protein